MQYLNIVDDESLRTVKPFPQPDSASQTVTIVATLQSYYEEMERDLDRRILMLINPLLATRVVQLYVAKVTDRAFMCDAPLTAVQGSHSWSHRQ
jgi:hypothetical protein